MNDDIRPYAAWLIFLGLIVIIPAIYGVVKGEINPYSHGAPKRSWVRRKEKPAFFWICAIGGLLIGLFLILYAIILVLMREN